MMSLHLFVQPAATYNHLMNMKLLCQSFLLLFLIIHNSPVSGAFTPWSEKVFNFVEKEYGEMAAKRLQALHELLVVNQGKSVMEKLELVNRTMNKMPWISDERHWKQADYWATPLETIATFGGDCEDIAIAKWIMLNHLGIANENLRFATVKIIQSRESHMVLLYVENPGASPKDRRVWVLDNYREGVRKARERKDLLAIYISDAEGNIDIIKDDGSERSITSSFHGRKLKKLEDLQAKIAANRKKYQELNGGIPLLPEN